MYLPSTDRGTQDEATDSDQPDPSECIICMDRRADRVMSCGHSYCSVCSTQYVCCCSICSTLYVGLVETRSKSYSKVTRLISPTQVYVEIQHI